LQRKSTSESLSFGWKTILPALASVLSVFGPDGLEAILDLTTKRRAELTATTLQMQRKRVDVIAMNADL
jgi:hypothetical protein